MEGYLISISQALKKIRNNPTHIFLQAGVGGLAASFASYCRKKLGYSPIIIIVEPEYAPCLQKSILKGKPVVVITENGLDAGSAGVELLKLGIAEVYLLKDGLISWQEESLPLVK